MAGITIFEVAPRDGLQNLSHFVATEDKLHLISLIEKTNVKHIEVASFVNPRLVPNMADGEEVVQGVLRRNNDVSYSVLVMNDRGLERAKAVGATKFNIVLSPDDDFNKKNFGKDLEAITAIYDKMLTDVPRGNVRVYISRAFGGCVEQLAEVVQKGLTYGEKIVLCDTSGTAKPFDIALAIDVANDYTENLAVHLHHGKNLMPNVETAYLNGVFEFDTSIGGLGGCPFVKDSGANLATEDLLRWCREKGIRCPLNDKAVREAAEFAKQIRYPTFTSVIKGKMQEATGRIRSVVRL